MTTYNVVVPVIANLDTDTPEAATGRLTTALEAAGFIVYDDPATRASLTPFEAEPGTETDDLPDQRTCRCQHGDYDHA